MKRHVIPVAMLCGALAAQDAPSVVADLSLPTGAALVEAVRNVELDPDQCYLVRDLLLVRDDIKLYFNDGYLIFSRPIAGQRIAAVFAGGEDAGDGELLLLPPRRDERQSLARFTGTPNFDEHFQAAVLNFTDDSAERLLNDILTSGRSRPTPEIGQVLAVEWTPRAAAVAASLRQRIVGDLLSPVPTDTGLFFAVLQGSRLGTFDIMFDPLSEDEIVAGQLSQRNGVLGYDIWTSFPSRESREAAHTHIEPVELSAYRIEALLDQTLRLKATTRATVTVGPKPVRAITFAISRAEQVTGVRLDGQPVEVLFQESDRTRALRANENDLFIIVTPDVLAARSVHEIELEHGGDVIEDRGSGVYSVGARSNWYPRVWMEFATYDLEFRYPRALTLVTSGEIVEDRTEGDTRITRRRTLTPVRLAGFNLGQFAHVTKVIDGINIDVYGNRGLDPALAPRPRTTVIQQSVRPLRGGPPVTQTTAIVQTPTPPDPLARMEAVATDVVSSLEFFSSLFGPPPFKTLTIAPLPGTAGQGFPGLIYLSTLSYLDEGQRPQSTQDARLKTFFTDLMVAHEVAHQWWGNTVAVDAYQDEWLMEALAHYSALLWLEKKRGADALLAELNGFRQDLLESGGGSTADSAGPLVWGYRLEGARNPNAFRIITYEKGAWVLHMLRRRMGDARFLAMLAELRRRYEFESVTTKDLESLVEEFGARQGGANEPPVFPASRVDEFFDSWVRSTGIPAARVRYQTSGRAPSVRLTGSVTYERSSQRAVYSGFATELPLEIQFANGTRRIAWVRSADGTETFSLTLPSVPSRIAIAPGMTLATGP